MVRAQLSVFCFWHDASICSTEHSILPLCLFVLITLNTWDIVRSSCDNSMLRKFQLILVYVCVPISDCVRERWKCKNENRVCAFVRSLGGQFSFIFTVILNVSKNGYNWKYYLNQQQIVNLTHQLRTTTTRCLHTQHTLWHSWRYPCICSDRPRQMNTNGSWWPGLSWTCSTYRVHFSLACHCQHIMKASFSSSIIHSGMLRGRRCWSAHFHPPCRRICRWDHKGSPQLQVSNYVQTPNP